MARQQPADRCVASFVRHASRSPFFVDRSRSQPSTVRDILPFLSLCSVHRKLICAFALNVAGIAPRELASLKALTSLELFNNSLEGRCTINEVNVLRTNLSSLYLLSKLS